MDQRLSLITLGVDNLARSRGFFEQGLGWRPLSACEDTAFYQLPGLVLGLFLRPLLAQDAQRPVDGGFSGVTLAINQLSPEAVDAAMSQALAAGARLLKQPVATSWGGYSGYFADLDGHTWELAHNPGCTIHPDGSTTFAPGDVA